jgi:hypothetical protein
MCLQRAGAPQAAGVVSSRRLADPPPPPSYTPAPPHPQVEEHLVDGQPRSLLVHRKGSTRAFPPHHPLIPVDYQLTGQPVLIGGTMGTCSYVLTGGEGGCWRGAVGAKHDGWAPP